MCEQYFHNDQMILSIGQKSPPNLLLSVSPSSGEDEVNLLVLSKSPNKLPESKDDPGANPSFILQDIISLNSLYLRGSEEEN